MRNKESKIVNGVYIRNIEAVDAYKIKERDGELKSELTGFIPYSLELIRLNKEKEFKIIKNGNKYVTDDVINVNFKVGYNDPEKVKQDEDYIRLEKERTELDVKKKALTKEISKIRSKINYRIKNNKEDENDELYEKLNEKMEVRANIEKDIQQNKSDKKEVKNKYKISTKSLRKILYVDGFECDGIRYIMYKRSGSKSRQGKVMFIKESLYNPMMEWCYMGIEFPRSKEIDTVAIGAYTSLVSSSIEDIITIKSKNILLIDDVESIWSEDCKLIYKNGEHLDVKEGIQKLTSCFTDGSSLLDKGYFEKGVDFKLLRNHMFKSCAFKTDIQLFFQDHFKSDYDNATVKDMFGNEMNVKDVHMICTPNSLKALKFSEFIGDGSSSNMYDYWKKSIIADDCIFGVCKHNKSSKWNFDGVEYQRTSYQMLNSLPMTKDDIKELLSWEIQYIEKLKNDIETFKQHCSVVSNMINCNDMMVDILNKCPEWEKTEIFRKWRSKTIFEYVNKVKAGKVKNIADYCTIISNPISYLKLSVGTYNEKELELVDNEVYTELFNDGEDVICFRNPHTSQANVYIGKNKYVADIKKYFNFGRNIIVVNCVKNPICQIMSGMDYDSDSCYVSNNETLLKVSKKCYGVYKVCENGIPKSNNKYYLTNESMADMDNKLSESKFTIGRVVNLGQLAMSKYWDAYNKSDGEKELRRLQKIVDICNILNGCAIDNAKREYDIDIMEEVEYLLEQLNIEKKPLFWRYVSKDKRLKDKEGRGKYLKKYLTTMDMLQGVLNEELENAESKGDISIEELLVEEIDRDDANRKQMNKIIDSVTKFSDDIEKILNGINEDNKEDSYRWINNKVDYEMTWINRMKITQETIYSLLLLAEGKGHKEKAEKVMNIRCRLLNVIYSKDKDLFLSVFKSHENKMCIS